MFWAHPPTPFISRLPQQPPKAPTPRANLNNIANRPFYDPSRIYKTPIVPRGPLLAQPAAKPSVAAPSPVVRKRPDSAQRESSEDRRNLVSPSPRGSYLEQQRMKRAAAEEERLKKKQAELIEKQKVN